MSNKKKIRKRNEIVVPGVFKIGTDGKRMIYDPIAHDYYELVVRTDREVVFEMVVLILTAVGVSYLLGFLFG